MTFKKIGRIGVLVVSVMLLMSSLVWAGIAEEPVRDIRVVYVKVAADQEYREFYSSDRQERTKNLIEKVSQAFEREFGIRFEVEVFEKWNSEVHKDISDFVEELRKEVKPGDSDLVIGFTGKGNRGESLGYVRRLLGNYLVLGDLKVSIEWWKREYEAHKKSYESYGWGEKQQEKFIKNLVERSEKVNQGWTLASRLGAIFGAFSISDSQKVSVMNGYLPYEKRTKLEFDEGNKKIIQANKDIDLKQLAQRRNQAEQELALVERCKLKIKTIGLSYEEEFKVWLEIVSHFDKAAELYEGIPTLGDLLDASRVREEALEILEALGLGEEVKQEYLGLAGLFIKMAQVYERAYQVGAAGISLRNIAVSYYAATSCFTGAGDYKNAAEYSVESAEYFEKDGDLSFAKKLYEWAAQEFEYLGEDEKAKEAREKAELVKLKIQEKGI